jgi:hypothetical protein
MEFNRDLSMAGTIAPKPHSTGAGLIEYPVQRSDPEPHQGTITPDHVLSPAEWDLILHAALITSIMEEVRRD